MITAACRSPPRRCSRSILATFWSTHDIGCRPVRDVEGDFAPNTCSSSLRLQRTAGSEPLRFPVYKTTAPLTPADASGWAAPAATAFRSQGQRYVSGQSVGVRSREYVCPPDLNLPKRGVRFWEQHGSGGTPSGTVRSGDRAGSTLLTCRNVIAQYFRRVARSVRIEVHTSQYPIEPSHRVHELHPVGALPAPLTQRDRPRLSDVVAQVSADRPAASAWAGPSRCTAAWR
jgi:hypothetical protein